MIREARTTNDLRQVARLAVPIWHEAFADIISQAQIDYMIERFQSFEAITDQVNNQGYRYFLCLLDDREVGYCGVQPQADGTLYLSKMYLLSEARRHGLFTEMTDHLRELCRKEGLSSIWLTVNRHNDHAIAAYMKNGFTIIREQVTDIGQGFVMDDYVFSLDVG